MTTQFRNFDAASRPQRVAITWTMLTPSDSSQPRPDTQDDGFWPSKDPEAPGYVEPGSYDAEMIKASARMAAWDAGRWHFIGVVARADIAVPIGGGSFVTHRFESAGLWGIESDAGGYLGEVYVEQKSELLGQLQTLAAALQSGDFDQEESA